MEQAAACNIVKMLQAAASLYYVPHSMFCMFVYVLSSRAIIMDQPDYNQPPGFGGATQVHLRFV